MKTFIELLSPARNLECGLAAIDHGADAVYLGAPRFGARAAAGNSLEDIAALCRYAHPFGVKVYVTVNTILYDEELAATRDLVWELHRIGVDALIVQDLALLRMDLPPIPLHASTQMDNRTPQKVQWLHSLGYAQTVLARELSLSDIRQIHESVPGMPLEAFVHGALCVSYSGRCYASQYCFGRSANRGECAQFCRLPFTLEDAEGHVIQKERHLLSLRDMNRSSSLEEMMDAGVRSFKIEGRLKDVAYVKNVTAFYRRRLDAIFRRRTEYQRSSLGHETFSFDPDPARSFSRGFTEYFLHGRTSDVSAFDTPKSKGQEVGMVKDIRRDCIVVAGTASFSNGDGLCYTDAEGHLCGFRVNRVEGNHLFLEHMPSSLRQRMPLFRSFDQSWERLLSRSTSVRKVHVRFLLAEEDEGFSLTFQREDGQQHTSHFPAEHQLARTDQHDQIVQLLSRMGDTIYEVSDVEIAFSQPWFIPRSLLAEWRRQVVSEFESRVQVHEARREEKPVEVPSSLDYQYNVSNRLSRQFYRESGAKDIQSALEVTPQTTGDRLLMTCRHCLRFQLGCCKKQSSPSTSWPEPWYLVSRDGRRFRLSFDCRECVMKVHSTL